MAWVPTFVEDRAWLSSECSCTVSEPSVSLPPPSFPRLVSSFPLPVSVALVSLAALWVCFSPEKL